MEQTQKRSKKKQSKRCGQYSTSIEDNDHNIKPLKVAFKPLPFFQPEQLKGQKQFLLKPSIQKTSAVDCQQSQTNKEIIQVQYIFEPLNIRSKIKTILKVESVKDTDGERVYIVRCRYGTEIKTFLRRITEKRLIKQDPNVLLQFLEKRSKLYDKEVKNSRKQY